MEISKLTSKYQATIPLEIRSILGLSKGDTILFEVSNNKVTLKKAPTIDWKYLSSVEKTLDEWNSEEDDEAFRNL
jgi:antitoxin PrlF